MYKKYQDSQLSIYEASIMVGLIKGKNSLQIAQDLELSDRTVHYMIKRLLEIYECEDIQALINLASHRFFDP